MLLDNFLAKNIQNYEKACRFQVSHWSAVLCRTYAQFSYTWPCTCVFHGHSTWVSTEIDICEVFSSCLKKCFKRPSTSMTHATDNHNISPKNAQPPNKKASKSGSRENTAYLKTVLHWKKDLKYPSPLFFLFLTKT